MTDKSSNPFENFCQRLTSFIGSHGGTVTALIIMTIALPVFLWDAGSHLANLVEKLLTMLSFVILFFLQRSQSRDTLSLQIKLNELIVAEQKIDSDLINLEAKSEAELKDLHQNLIALHNDEIENSPEGLLSIPT